MGRSGRLPFRKIVGIADHQRKMRPGRTPSHRNVPGCYPEFLRICSKKSHRIFTVIQCLGPRRLLRAGQEVVNGGHHKALPCQIRAETDFPRVRLAPGIPTAAVNPNHPTPEGFGSLRHRQVKIELFRPTITQIRNIFLKLKFVKGRGHGKHQQYPTCFSQNQEAVNRYLHDLFSMPWHCQNWHLQNFPSGARMIVIR